MKEEYESCSSNMGALSDALYVIGGKWRIPILGSILAGNHRFREIERSIPKLSTKVLSAELKTLEQNHLVTRTVFDDTPVSVLYRPTDHAKSLGKVLDELIKWGQAHGHKIRGNYQIENKFG
jgi:DNA-binding HxlR family transcriptional regulator